LYANARGTIRNSIIETNTAHGGGGLTVSQAELEIAQSTIRGNKAENYGGGVYIFDSKTSISDSLIVENYGRATGGIFADNRPIVAGQGPEDGMLTTILNSTISDNKGGFGLSNEFNGRMILSHSTVTMNPAGVGAGGPLAVISSIIAGNGINDVYGPDFISHGYNLVGNGKGLAAFNQPGDLVGVDPLLAPLADNGGPTLTHALLPGSPAIGAGDPALVPGIGGVPEFDQRGAPFTRVAGARIDIGAFEVQSPDGALTADFDLNGLVDGADFLAWQRNLGKTSGATIRHGDATADGDVDSSDLAVWRARFGAGADAPAVLTAALQPVANNGAGQRTPAPRPSSEQLVAAAQRLARSALPTTALKTSTSEFMSRTLARQPHALPQSVPPSVAWRPAVRGAVQQSLSEKDAERDSTRQDAEHLNFAAAIDELLGRQ
jgi:hypothetical protein